MFVYVNELNDVSSKKGLNEYRWVPAIYDVVELWDWLVKEEKLHMYFLAMSSTFLKDRLRMTKYPKHSCTIEQSHLVG